MSRLEQRCKANAYSRAFRKRHRVRVRVRGRELYQLNRDHIRARKKANRARNRDTFNDRARLRYRQKRDLICEQKRAAYQRNIVHVRARGLRWRHAHLQKCRERDRLAKWNQMRREGRPTRAEIRANSNKPEVIEARRLHKKQYMADYSRKHRKRLSEQNKLRNLKNLEHYRAYQREWHQRRVVTPEQRAKWEAQQRQRKLIAIQNLDDSYLRELICNASPRVTGLQESIPGELLELKRLQITLVRQIKRKEGKGQCTQAKLAA